MAQIMEKGDIQESEVFLHFDIHYLSEASSYKFQAKGKGGDKNITQGGSVSH